MSRGKIEELFPEKYELKQKLEKNWQNFLNLDTYLIHDEKRKFFQVINQLTKFPFYIFNLLFNFLSFGRIF
jgi:hypothetical protein